MLWGRSANLCAFPGCRKSLVEDETKTDNPSIVGDECHIVAKELDGPRGNPSLSYEGLDKYDNLILLCKIHHKIIDDQPNTYTVEKLKEMKEQHIEWINKDLSIDNIKLKDDEIYASYVDKWVELANISEWNSWTSHIFGSGQPHIQVKIFKNLEILNEYILSRIWPKRYLQLEESFNNFRYILNDFIQVFSKYSQEEGSDDYKCYNTPRFYQIDEWDEEKYERLSKKYEYHVALVEDLMLELTRAANHLCDQIRKYISTSFRMKEGILLITYGPLSDLSFETRRVEYKNVENDNWKYQGLRKFMIERSKREFYFGTGVSKDYF